MTIMEAMDMMTTMGVVMAMMITMEVVMDTMTMDMVVVMDIIGDQTRVIQATLIPMTHTAALLQNC